MKYFSETLNKTFNSEQECLDAEKKYEEERKKNDLVLAEKKAAVSKRKKELSDAIAEADKKVDNAYKGLEAAKKEAAAIIKETREKANNLINEAAKKVESETSERANQIGKFNEEFGPYMVTYTGNRAEEEYNRMIHQIREMFDFNPFSFSFHWPF